MDKLPELLSKSIQAIISSQELSSWTIHNGHNTTVTLRFKCDNSGGTPPSVENSCATWHKSSNSRLARDQSRAHKNRITNNNDHFLRSKAKSNIELPRKASDSDMISSLSPDAVEFVPIPSPPLIPTCSPSEPPPAKSLQSVVNDLPNAECIPATDGCTTSPCITAPSDGHNDSDGHSSGTDDLLDLYDNNNSDESHLKVPYTGMFSALSSDNGESDTDCDASKTKSDTASPSNSQEVLWPEDRPYVRRYHRVLQRCFMCTRVIKEPRPVPDCDPVNMYVNLCAERVPGMPPWDGYCVKTFKKWQAEDQQKHLFSLKDYMDENENGEPVKYAIGSHAPWDP